MVGTAGNLGQFGYDVFDGSAGNFLPMGTEAAGPDYVVGPGDRFTLSLWGKVNGSFPLEVGADGKVMLPRAGTVTVWGQTLERVRGSVQAALKKQYGEVSVALTPERLRTVSVYVVGEVARPGTYSLPSYATAYGALAAAGGPTKDGTLRRVTLRRRGEEPRVFDLYEFLLRGDRAEDVRVQAGDALHVDVIGAVVGVAGEVKREGIFELSGATTLRDVMDLAGGVTAFADLARVQIERVDREGDVPRRVIVEVSPAGGEDAAWTTPVQDGDLVRVFSVLPERRDVVYLEGHVRREGPYAFRKGMTVRELLSSYDALMPEPYLARAEIHRVLPPDDRPDLLAFDLGRLLEGDASADVALAERDRIRVFAKPEMDELEEVEVMGEVRRPAVLRLTPGLTVRDLVLTAGSVKPSAELDRAELVRTEKVDGRWTVTRREISLRRALDGEEGHDLPLRARDRVFVRQAPDWPEQAVVTLRGEVKHPGQYAFTKGERLSSVLARAGGFTDESYLRGAFFMRASAREVQRERLELLSLAMERNLLSVMAESDVKSPGKAAGSEGAEKALRGEQELLERLKTAVATGRVVVKLDEPARLANSEWDVLLENGDDLFVPKRPSTVHVVGEVYNPGASLWKDDLEVRDLLGRVGGLTPDGHKRAVFVVRADGTVVSKKNDGSMFRTFEGLELQPGDAVVVPRRVRRFSGWQATLDTSQLLFNLALTAGVILAAF